MNRRDILKWYLIGLSGAATGIFLNRCGVLHERFNRLWVYYSDEPAWGWHRIRSPRHVERALVLVASMESTAVDPRVTYYEYVPVEFIEQWTQDQAPKWRHTHTCYV